MHVLVDFPPTAKGMRGGAYTRIEMRDYEQDIAEKMFPLDSSLSVT